MHGKDIAGYGYLCEQYTTCHINYYMGNYFDGGNIKSTLDPADQSLVFHDTKSIAHAVIDYTNEYHGKIKQAKHVGYEINYGVVDVTSKKSPADVVVEVEDFGWLGVSLKYGMAKRESNRIKVYAPPPLTLAKQIDAFFFNLFGQSSGIVSKIEALTDDKMIDAHDLVVKNQKLLTSVFGYAPLKLNKARLSTLRKIIRGEIEYPDPQLIQEFYEALRASSSSSNKAMANEFADVISYLFDCIAAFNEKEKATELMRILTNIPAPGDPEYLPTILVYARHSGDGFPPSVGIFDYAKDFDAYLATETVSINKKPNRCCFQLGPVTIEVNCRAGSRHEGAVNITLDKKILTNVRFQKLSNRKEDQDEPDRDGQAQGQVEGVSSIPGGLGRKGEE